MSSFARAELDVVSVDGLRIDCIVGVYPHERVQAQPLVVDVALLLDTRTAAAQAAFDHTVDYARLAAEVRFILAHGRFGMLETAGDALARWTLAAGRFVDAARVRLVKPDALGGAGVPSVVVVRRAEEVVLAPRETAWGSVETIAASRVCRVERATITPGRAYTPPTADGEEAGELVLGDEVAIDGVAAAPGSTRDGAVPRRYTCTGEAAQALLVVVRQRAR